MKNQITLSFFFVIFCSQLSAQNFDEIVVDVNTIALEGTPGHLNPLDALATAIVAANPCSGDLYNYSLATTYENGRVIAISHEGILANSNFNNFDNETFFNNIIRWLNNGNNRAVRLKEGWINNGNSTALQQSLMDNDYSFGNLFSTITNESLSNPDVLILGNDWNNIQAYTIDELNAIEEFVANGGGLLILGLGWSWPESLSEYPMNQVAQGFGIEFTRDFYSDNTFTNFYPIDFSNNTPYCPFPEIHNNISRGDNLRVLRMAVSTNGEFTQQNGGVTNTSNLVAPWLEQINEMYGREYCMRFEIIPDNDALIFADPNSDPWGTLPPGSGGCDNANIILSQQASVIDDIIGTENYDVSHVIAGSPFGGGSIWPSPYSKS